MKKISLHICVLQIAVIQGMILERTEGSVLPRPNYKSERATTQILSTSKNLSDETVVIVTSSELPKQIPPPPTPTKSQGVTPQYDNNNNINNNWEQQRESGTRGKRTISFPYSSFESAITFQKLV